MRSPFELVADRGLRSLARALVHHPRWFFYPQAALFAASLLLTVRHLEFSTNRDDLVGADKEYHRNFIEYKKDFRAEEELVAVAESEDSEKNRQFVERLGARLLTETNLFTDVMFHKDVKMLGDKALLFFPEPELLTLEQTLEDYRPFLEQFTAATNLNAIFRMVNQRFRAAARGGEEEGQSLVQVLPAFRRIVEQATAAMDRPGNPPSPGVSALFDAGPEAEQQIYITFDHGRLYAVTARPIRRELKGKAVQRLRELVELTRREVSGVNALITGEPVLEVDEMAQSQRDTTMAAAVSLLLVSLIFVYGYRESGRPLKATACLVVGLAYTMAYATATIGHLNILTITFVPMLIGLAIDFGVHLVTRYEEELRHGRGEAEAIEQALVHTGQGIFTGCLTTAAAFFAMGLTDFRGIEEMGIICGGGLLICLVPMLTLLPVLILRGRQNVLDHEYVPEATSRARVERLWLDRPWIVLGLAISVSLVAWTKGHDVPFDYNLLNLQSRDLPAVVLEK
jgi:predicted RND superfamily exporter protein